MIDDVAPSPATRLARRVLPYAAIAALVLSANLVATTALETLYQDDMAVYLLMHTADPDVIASHTSTLYNRGFAHVVLLPVHHALASSPTAARVLLLLVFLVPISMLAFLLFRDALRLPWPAALAAAVLPNVMPGQYEIPQFVSGSYTLPMILAYLGSLVSGYRFATSEASRSRWLSLSLALTVATFLLGEPSVFLVPGTIVFYAFVARRPWKKGLYVLAGTNVALAALRMAWVVLVPMTQNTAHSLTAAERWGRVGPSLGIIDPLAFLLNSYAELPTVTVSATLVVLAALVVFGSLLWRRFGGTDELGPQPGSSALYFPMLLGLVWAVPSMAPFILVTQYFVQRYFHLAGFGYSLFFVSAVVVVITWFARAFRAELALIPFVVVVAAARVQATREFNRMLDGSYDRAAAFLTKLDLPKDAQVVIGGVQDLAAGGYWTWSTGLLQYATRRDDVSGLLGAEQRFIDPFVKGHEYYTSMVGIREDRPVFFFRRINGEYVPQRFVLRWEGKGRDAPWALEEYDPRTGQRVSVEKGLGFDALKILVGSRNGLKIEDVMFAGPDGPT